MTDFSLPDDVRMRGFARRTTVADALANALLGVAGDGVVELRPVLGVGELLAADPHDGERGGEQALPGEVVQRGHELARGEVPRAAEDDEHRRLRDAREAQSRAKRVRRGGQRHLLLLHRVAAELRAQRGGDLHRVRVLLA